MTTVTVNLTTLLATAAGLGAGLVAWGVRQARRQTKLAERMNWLINRYARDHDHATPWDDPIPDGGPRVRCDDRDRGDEEEEGDSC